MQGFQALYRDVRHMSARAATDLADWLVHLEVEGKSDRTLYAYPRIIAPLLREFPDKRLEDFTHHDINLVLGRIPRQSRHINRSVYNRFFDWAYRIEERIDRNPVDKVPQIRPGRRRPKEIFSETEVAKLEALPMPDGQLMTLMLWAGLRRGECRLLRRRDIDLNRARLMVYHGKGDKDRVVGLPPAALMAVADLDLLAGLAPDHHLWYSVRGQGKYRTHRTPIADSTFDRWWHKQINAAEVRYLNPHQTRHTYAWILRHAGFDADERAFMMGHESSRTTEKYYDNITADDLAEKVAKL
jgi:integrase